MMEKSALIIGASSGIGLATVKKLATNGYRVVAIHRDRRQQVEGFDTQIEQLKKDSKSQIITKNMDATSEEKVASFLDEIEGEVNGGFHLVVHAVSRGNLKPFISDSGSLTPQDLELTISSMGTNLQLWVAKLIYKKLINRGSRIISLTSEGNDRFWPGYGAIALAKSTLETLTRYLAVELAPRGISVNTLQAGVTDTPSLRLIPEVEELLSSSKKRNPSGRLTTPEDVANVIYLMGEPEAAWINGSHIHVDGGEHLV